MTIKIMFDKVNIFFAFIVSVLILYSIKIVSNMFEGTTITDWLSVIIYAATFYAAFMALQTAKKALQENKVIALDTKRMADDNNVLVQAQTEPFIDIKLEIMPQSVRWIRLKITNISLSSAFNVKFVFSSLDDEFEEVNSKIISIFTSIKFMEVGLSYLSKGDFRYTNFINLLESDSERGFTVDDFLNAKLIVEITYNDAQNKIYNHKFKLIMNELGGTYSIGDTPEEKIIKELKLMNSNLSNLNLRHIEFKKEYEKAHRDWTEEELREQLMYIDRMKQINKLLGKEEEPIEDKRISKRTSIQELRKKNR